MPPGYQGKPSIYQHLLFIWDAFWELSSDRQMGFGAEGRIPSAAIRAYARDYGLITHSDLRWFVMLIRVMDAEYLELRRPKDKDAPAREVRLNDVAGIKALLRTAAANREREDEEEASADDAEFTELDEDDPPEEE